MVVVIIKKHLQKGGSMNYRICDSFEDALALLGYKEYGTIPILEHDCKIHFKHTIKKTNTDIDIKTMPAKLVLTDEGAISIDPVEKIEIHNYDIFTAAVNAHIRIPDNYLAESEYQVDTWFSIECYMWKVPNQLFVSNDCHIIVMPRNQ
jgi:hypothetical protein